MSEALQGGAIFNALDGREVAKAVAAQIEPAILAELEQNSDFAGHITYPVVEWRWVLEVKAYPHEPGSFRAKTAGKLIPPKITIFRGSRTVDSSDDSKTPDAVRVESGQPVSRPEKTSAGIMADVPQPLQEKRSGQ